ncbi:MAG: rhomboid family intramembrane serine protease [Gammaproteobacteria bacterium]|nr:rhomboid family intramembrane serine protease [Gammaproteobacteria bacterium]
MTKLHFFFKKMPVTFSLIALSCFFSVITWFGHIDATLIWLYYSTDLIANGEVWRIITPLFLHFPAMGIVFAHLAFNMILLYQFGEIIESCDSSKFLLILVATAGILSNITQGYVFTGLFGGMSGVVYALLGYIFVLKKIKPSYPGFIPDNIAYFLIGFMVISSLGLFGDSIANTAHVIGFFVGVGFAFFQGRKKKSNLRTLH